MPVGAKKAYTSSRVWRGFKNIIEDVEAAGISSIEVDESHGAAEYYTLKGIKVSAPTEAGIYIVKKDGKSKTIVVK